MSTAEEYAFSPTIDSEKSNVKFWQRAKFDICLFFAVALNLCRFNGWRTSTSSVTNHKPGDKKGHSLATWVALRYSAGV